MAVPESFYVRDGEAFVATALTRGPWSSAHQHGGPPSALLAGEAQRYGGDDAARFFVARLSVDYLKPIPVGKLTVAVEPQKLGKTAQRLSLHLLAEGDVLARATALRIRRSTGPLSSRPPPLPPPHGFAPFEFPFFQDEVAYHRGVEGRYAKGRFGDNAVTVWMRQTAPLVEGETPSGLQRVVLVADAESGVCNPLDIARYTFVNPDLTVLLDREPVGEWIGLDVLSTASEHGIGLAQSAVHDALGVVGRSAQTLVIEPRPDA